MKMARSEISAKFFPHSAATVPGYIVNVHDAINFDIDLFLTPQQRVQYRHVITNEYQYKEESSTEEVKIGKVYRCRLKGIQVSDHASRKTKSELYVASQDIIQMTDRSNGWIICVIDSVDVYNRLLVDLLDPVTCESLKDFLFHQYESLFTEYIPHIPEEKRRRW